MSLTIETIHTRVRDYLVSQKLKDKYEPVTKRSRTTDTFILYEAGSRRNFGPFTYGGTRVASVELIARDKERRYENGTIGNVESKIPGLSFYNLRRIAQGQPTVAETASPPQPTTGVFI